MTSLLTVDGIDTYYGDSHILRDLSLDVREGETVALLGRNGAGKTTTLRSIMGMTPPASGDISFAGTSLVGLEPYEISRLGIGYVPEERNMFPDITVEHNLEVVMQSESEWSYERIFEEFPILDDLRDSKSQNLSGGEQQMLAIARALATGPDLLLLDEPSEGLAPTIIDDLRETIRTLIDDGLVVLITEQNIEFALSLADRAYVIDKGTREWEGSTAELREREDVINEYLMVSG